MRAVTQSAVPRDITDDFTTAASKLRTGQLVKDEYFTLFEAVGALEIMDSKMDSGYLGPGETNAQALEDDYDLMRELAPEEVLGIMDELLCHEMAWHMGHPLSQTLFTSLYLDRLLWPVPKTLEDAHFLRGQSQINQEVPEIVHTVLRAYCLALVKSCDFVHARVTTEYYFEEEDFVTQLYNRTLLSQFDSKQFYDLLDRAVRWIDEQTGIVSEKVAKAIKARLLFRREFLWGLEQDIEVIETRFAEQFRNCLSHLDFLSESTVLGREVPESFSWKIQRKLASTVPPRPMVKISFEDALAHLKRLCQDAVDLLEILDYRGPYNLKVLIWTLLSRKPQPSVYIRSLVQSLIVSNRTILGAVPAKQFLYDELEQIVLPSSILLQASADEIEVPSDPRFQIAQHMDVFTKRFSQPFVDTFRSACLNRCRIRRTVCHTLVDWDNLQMEAEDLDEQLRALSNEPPLKLANGDTTYSYPLSSWAYHHKLSQFRLILQLGFELSIYSPEELPGMYWYLSHICSTHLGHIDRIRTFTVATAKRNLTDLAAKKRGAFERHTVLQRSIRLLERLTTQIVAVDAFAISLHALYVLLARHCILPTTSSAQAYSSDRLRYEIRMKPFLQIALPELVPYDEYRREAILEGDSDDTVLERATKAISEARKAWEATLANGAFIHDSDEKHSPALAIEDDWKRDIKDTMRACIGASIAIETVKKALRAQAESRKREGEPQSFQPVHLRVAIPEVGSKARWHDWWVVPQVSPATTTGVSKT
ncbi:N-alpha-acetyltransferase 35, NatC auxiliary subunit [Aspergillus homomorphus CBS 101889]|uniref:Putative amino-acid N-acetyltransferase subunit Mak10 n=1 Tax=Aspergillus homomorphus (strain CBS 101889) TaxID=1450537 RepID=A0A395I8D4_ASPHC|nr:putative amino-acid N-acetyltransferase subunit Mak10 [Aspergillus homomorphus CBS 101889]RAL15298.1 putative amino-acid N-acetyltransferase subunit Mak10 [Aspergillus homomorphus CBS 101889]